MNELIQGKVKVTLRLTASHSVSLGVKPNLMIRYESNGLDFVGRSL
jgi:hypothetical protein